ncbi:MAG: hypothetical protein WC365_03550 [Candidatus Babeliales bacterium]
MDIKQAFAQSKKFQSALSTAIDAAYKNLLSATKQIAQGGSKKAAKTAATKALKKVKKGESSSFSRYAKIAAIAALAAVVVAYGGVNLSERQGSAVGPWTQRGVPAPAVMPLQGTVSNVSLPSPTAGVVSPEISALVQQARTEGAASSPYEPAPTYETDPVKNLFDVAGEHYASQTRIKNFETIGAALDGLRRSIGDRAVYFIDKISDIYTDVLVAKYQSGDKGWIYYKKSGGKLYFIEWNYKKDAFDLGKEIEVPENESVEYMKLISARAAGRIRNLDVGITRDALEDVFGYTPANPQKNLFNVVGESGAQFVYEFESNTLDGALAHLIEVQGQGASEQLLLIDEVGDYKRVLLATVDSSQFTPDRHGWVYYEKSASSDLRFAEWNYKVNPKAWFYKKSFNIDQDKALELNASEQMAYGNLIEKLKAETLVGRVEEIYPILLKDAFDTKATHAVQGTPKYEMDPTLKLYKFAGNNDVYLKSYGMSLTRLSLEEILVVAFNSQNPRQQVIDLFDGLNGGEYENVIVAIRAMMGNDPLTRSGWLYYKDSTNGKFYFINWNSKANPEQKNEVVLNRNQECEVTQPEEIARYERLYKFLNSYKRSSFKFSKLPREVLYVE